MLIPDCLRHITRSLEGELALRDRGWGGELTGGGGTWLEIGMSRRM